MRNAVAVASVIRLRITVAEAADRNCTDDCTEVGISSRDICSKPSFGKKRSAVVVNRNACAVRGPIRAVPRVGPRRITHVSPMAFLRIGVAGSTARRRTVLQLLFALTALVPVDSTAQTPVQSFDQLNGVVSPGMSVVVQTADGRRATGKVLSLSGAAIEIDRQLWFFRVRTMSIPAGSVRRVEKRDSTWNGALIGVGIGAAATVAECVATRNNPGDWSCLEWALIAPLAGGAIGEGIDARIRQPLYISGPRVQLSPVGGRGRIGVVAAVRF